MELTENNMMLALICTHILGFMAITTIHGSRIKELEAYVKGLLEREKQLLEVEKTKQALAEFGKIGYDVQKDDEA